MGEEVAMCGRASSSERSKMAKGALSKLRTSYNKMLEVLGEAMARTVAVGS